MTKSLEAYYAVALQLHCKSLNNIEKKEDTATVIQGSIAHLDNAIAGAKRFLGNDIQLIVVPEYFMTGHPMGESLEEWRDKGSIDVDGPQYEALAVVAQKHKIYLSGNAYERDRHFPDFYFQASFIINPSGDIVLRYRRLISMYSPSPYDVWEKYIDIYGKEAIFPVAKTEIGRLATVASEEILYPELSRILASRGAEVLLHSTSEVASGQQTIKNIAKQARAIENLVYVVSANSAGISGSPVLSGSTDANSKIINYKGDILMEAGYGESINAFAEIDLSALQRYRRRPAMGNLLARQPMQLYASFYGDSDIQAGNELMTAGTVSLPDRSFFLKRQARIIEKLESAGII